MFLAHLSTWMLSIVLSMLPLLITAGIALIIQPYFMELTQFGTMIFFRKSVATRSGRFLVFVITMSFLVPLCLLFQQISLASGLPEQGVVFLSAQRNHAYELYTAQLLLLINVVGLGLASWAREVTAP